MRRAGLPRGGQAQKWKVNVQCIIIVLLVFVVGVQYQRMERMMQLVAKNEGQRAEREADKRDAVRSPDPDSQEDSGFQMEPPDADDHHEDADEDGDRAEAPGECVPGHCPFCGHTERKLFKTEGPHKLWKCEHCGFLYLYPMPEHPPNVTYPEGWVGAKVVANKQKVEEFFDEAELAGFHSWLDVGAGNGELLKAVQQAEPRINATGLETNEMKIKGAAKHGLTVVNRDLGGIRERYDVVSFMNVLSHVACPIGFYRALARLLVADGCLFMCTGNAADLEDPDQNPSKSYSLPDHVVFGGLRHSVQLMEQAGLEVRRLRAYKHFWHNYRPFRKGPFRAMYIRACRPKPGAAPAKWTDARYKAVLEQEDEEPPGDDHQPHRDLGPSEDPHVLRLTPSEVDALVVKEEPPPGTDDQNLCPICGETEHTVFKREAGHSLGKCSRCGFLYLNPMPFGIDPDKKTYRENWETPKVAAMKAKVQAFWSEEELQGMRKWLDVGAGNGELLMALRHLNADLDALGIETTQYKIEHATAKGLTVIKKPLEDFAADSYDVVSAMNVLSHVARPVGFYAALGRIVRPGGCIWMSTGNAADIPMQEAPGRFDLPDHLVFAGRRHVYTIFHRMGFHVKSYQEFKHFWHNYRPLKPGRFRAVYVRACKPS